MIENVKTLVLQTADLLTQQGLKLATAESCTGGGLSYWLTSVPGSSKWFECGFVTYSIPAKISILDVSANTIDRFGAVSEETAREMVAGALWHSEADLAISITGVAGPDTDSDASPIGRVWIAWAGKNMATKSQMETFSGDRQTIRLAAIAKALEELNMLLVGVIS